MGVGQQIFAGARIGACSPGPTDFRELEVFLLSRRVENCSPATLRTYRQRIGAFLVCCGKAVTEIERSDVERYLLSLKDKGRSPHYVRSNYRELRVFFSWLLLDGVIPKSPMKNIGCPKVPKYAKEFLPDRDFARLLSLCIVDDFRGARNAAWLWLLWSTGGRWHELANLRLADLDWNKHRIKVMGKGSKERFVPFTREAEKAVYVYLKARSRYLSEDEYPELWITEERRPLSALGLQSVTKRLYQRSGVKVKDMHHVFRRTWAWRNLKAGISPKFVQLIGGWDTLAVLEQYVKRMSSEDALNLDWR